MTNELTKESVIRALVEAFSNYGTPYNDCQQIINAWRKMPAKEVTAEAESCFGFNAIDKNGVAFAKNN